MEQWSANKSIELPGETLFSFLYFGNLCGIILRVMRSGVYWTFSRFTTSNNVNPNPISAEPPDSWTASESFGPSDIVSIIETVVHFAESVDTDLTLIH